MPGTFSNKGILRYMYLESPNKWIQPSSSAFCPLRYIPLETTKPCIRAVNLWFLVRFLMGNMRDKQGAQAFLRNFIAPDGSHSKITRDLQIQECCQSPELVFFCQPQHLLWLPSLISKPSFFSLQSFFSPIAFYKAGAPQRSSQNVRSDTQTYKQSSLARNT